MIKCAGIKGLILKKWYDWKVYFNPKNREASLHHFCLLFCQFYLVFLKLEVE